MIKLTAGMLVVVAFAFVVMVPGCAAEDQDDQAEVARQVASQWVQSNTEELIGEMVLAVRNSPAVSEELDKVPSLVADIASDRIEQAIIQQIRDHLSVELPVPTRSSDGSYGVTATLGLQLAFDLPVVGQRSYSAEVPLDLTVDVQAREVERWRVDLAGVKVEDTSTQ